MSRLSAHTKRKLDGAIDEVKRDKFAALVLLFDQEVGEVEVLCSETNNPMIVAEMARAALEGLTRSTEDGRKESLVH